MNDPNVPPLDPRAFEVIKLALHRVDKDYWPLIAAMRVPKFVPLEVPMPPQLPTHLLNQLELYSAALFKAEADQYKEFRDHQNYPPWLSRLADRVYARVLDAIEKIEGSDPNATLWYHGLTQPQIHKTLRTVLGNLASIYSWKDFDTHVPSGKLEAQIKSGIAVVPGPVTGKAEQPFLSRLPSVIHSPSAARKMEAYLAAKGIGLTDFACTAGTTDRTLRSFRKTGKIRRSLLAGIATAMGVTKDDLIK